MTEAGTSRVRRAFEDFRSGITPPSDVVRSVVRDSWMRSIKRGLDPAEATPEDDTTATLTLAEFARYRETHPITSVRPLVQDLMLDDIADSGVVVALTDQAGRLLWVEGSTEARDRASRINFVEGSVWSEDVVGTNAPGLALAVGKGVQVIGDEHFAGSVQDFSCAAAPVHDPLTGHVIGVIDVTGGREVAAPFALAAVRSVVAAVERELHSRALDLGDPKTFTVERGGARLTVLADSSYQWQREGDAGGQRTLSRRHAEILLLLQEFPEGLNTEQLALHLAGDGIDPVTVRAEISRLRRDLGTDVVSSRPYRLTVEMTSDLGDLRRRIVEGGELSSVIDEFGRGGLLVESTAPGVAEIFEVVREDLRSRVIAEGEVGALRKWTSSIHGRDDLTAWRRLEHRLPVGHPDRAVAGGRIRLLDRRYGV